MQSTDIATDSTCYGHSSYSAIAAFSCLLPCCDCQGPTGEPMSHGWVDKRMLETLQGHVSCGCTTCESLLLLMLLLLLLLHPQLHKTPQGTFYFSRRGREHGELTGYTVFDKVLHAQVRSCKGYAIKLVDCLCGATAWQAERLVNMHSAAAACPVSRGTCATSVASVHADVLVLVLAACCAVSAADFCVSHCA